MKVLVTGASGFIGCNVVHGLAGLADIYVTSVSQENPLPAACHVVAGERWPAVDAVIHLAANNDTQCSDEEAMFAANVYQPIKMFQALADKGCRQFIWSSSTAVYGNSPPPYHEDKTPLSPVTPYSRSKAAFEEYTHGIFTNKYPQAKITTLRLCNVYGPGEGHKGNRMSMVGQMIRQAMRGGTVKLFAPGNQMRDWVWVADVVRVVQTCLLQRKVGVFNVGTGQAMTFNGIYWNIMYELGMNDLPEYVPNPFAETYQTHTCCDITKLKSSIVDWHLCDVPSGIRQYIQHLKEKL